MNNVQEVNKVKNKKEACTVYELYLLLQELFHLIIIQSIEKEGHHPSFQVFYNLVTLFDISVDQYLFPNKDAAKSILRRQIGTVLDGLDEKELIVVEGTVKGICKAKE